VPVIEEAISFVTPADHCLRGILHRPTELDHGAPAVLWLSAGQKVRQGAWRMNVVIARRLAAAGIPVLRFDYHGIGESEGPDRHGQFVMDLYGFIQTGGFKHDVAAAAHGLRERVGARPLVLGGLCGGAVSALFAASLIDDVASLLLVDLPVTISSAARQRYLEEHPEELIRARPGEAETVMALYLRRLTDPAAWRRLVSGETNYLLLAETLKVRARARVDAALPRLPAGVRGHVEALLAPLLPPVVAEAPAEAAAGGEDAKARAAGEERNALVVQVFRELRRKRLRMSFLNSSAYHPTFQAFFGAEELGGDEAALRADGIDLGVVPDTNHIFSIDPAKRALFARVDALVREATRAPAASAARRQAA
jgi:pimeloyl-ACP methyl ester carboxylesterase